MGVSTGPDEFGCLLDCGLAFVLADDEGPFFFGKTVNWTEPLPTIQIRMLSFQDGIPVPTLAEYELLHWNEWQRFAIYNLVNQHREEGASDARVPEREGHDQQGQEEGDD